MRIWYSVVLCLAFLTAPQVVVPREGTGSIGGRVIAGDTGQPIARCRVVATGRKSRHDFSTVADAQGRYDLDALPPGDYRLRAERPKGLTAYLSTHFGSGGPDTLGRTLRVEAGGELTADFALPRAATIAGRILDDRGRPVTGATVTLSSDRLDNQGQPRTIVSPRTRADGRYRVDSLAQGTYRIQAQPPIRPDDRGRALAPTWYRSTRDSDLAEPVSIVSGQQFRDVDVRLAREPVLTLRGRVYRSDGMPAAQATVRLAYRVLTAIRFNNYPTRDDGTFEIPRLFAGEYEAAAGQGTPIDHVAARHVTLRGDGDNAAVDLYLQPGGTVDGRVSVRGGQDAGLVSVESLSPDRMGAVLTPQPRAPVGEDGSFHLDAQFGPRLLRVRDLPPNLCLEAVTLGSRDITNVPATFPANARNEVDIVVGPRRPVLSGHVELDQSMDAVVVILADDPAQWVRESTTMSSAWPGADGSFEMTGLPPGDYRVIATDKPPRGFVERQRDALEWLWRNGTAVTLHAHEIVSVSLHVTRLP